MQQQAKNDLQNGHSGAAATHNAVVIPNVLQTMPQKSFDCHIVGNSQVQLKTFKKSKSQAPMYSRQRVSPFRIPAQSIKHFGTVYERIQKIQKFKMSPGSKVISRSP